MLDIGVVYASVFDKAISINFAYNFLPYFPRLRVWIVYAQSTARRDREVKRKLYSRCGAEEYWIVSWQERRLEIYRRKAAVLTLDCTLNETDTIQSPLLPGFSCEVSQLFSGRLPF